MGFTKLRSHAPLWHTRGFRPDTWTVCREDIERTNYNDLAEGSSCPPGVRKVISLRHSVWFNLPLIIGEVRAWDRSFFVLESLERTLFFCNSTPHPQDINHPTCVTWCVFDPPKKNVAPVMRLCTSYVVNTRNLKSAALSWPVAYIAVASISLPIDDITVVPDFSSWRFSISVANWWVVSILIEMFGCRTPVLGKSRNDKDRFSLVVCIPAAPRIIFRALRVARRELVYKRPRQKKKAM